ncbi:MAG: hypothetical protein ACTSXP_15070 [Promethearchaeota archaeon]
MIRSIEGPTIIYSVPALEKGIIKSKLSRIPRLMDVLNKETVSLTTFDDLYALNYFFHVTDKWVRGNERFMLLSIVMEIKDKKESKHVISFLLEKENMLKDFANLIIEDTREILEKINSREYVRHLKKTLHSFYARVFLNGSRVDLGVHDKGWITVFSPNNLDTDQIFNDMRKKLFVDGSNLKARLINQVLNELEFNHFSCLDRLSETCMRSNCPVCKDMARESNGAIIFFEAGIKRDVNVIDLKDYIKNIAQQSSMPILLLEYDTTRKSIPSNIKLKANVWQEIKARLEKAGISNPIYYKKMELEKSQDFQEAITWLIKKLI